MPESVFRMIGFYKSCLQTEEGKMRITNLQNESRSFAKSLQNFHVLEYTRDTSVSPLNAETEYFMSRMNWL